LATPMLARMLLLEEPYRIRQGHIHKCNANLSTRAKLETKQVEEN